MKELMIKENDLVEVHNSPYLPLNKSKGVVLQVFPYLRMAVVSFPLEVKHHESDVDETYTYDKWFLPYKNLTVIASERTAYEIALEKQLKMLKDSLELSDTIISDQEGMIAELFACIEKLRKGGNEPQYL